MITAVHRRGVGGVKKTMCIHDRNTIFTHRQYILIYFAIFIVNYAL